MISRAYAERWFPTFVAKLDGELAQAKCRSDSIVKDLLVPQGDGIRRYANGNKVTRYEERGDYWNAAGPRVELAVKLAKEGKSKTEIAKEMTLSPITVAHYLKIARRRNMLPSDFSVRNK